METVKDDEDEYEDDDEYDESPYDGYDEEDENHGGAEDVWGDSERV